MFMGAPPWNLAPCASPKFLDLILSVKTSLVVSKFRQRTVGCGAYLLRKRAYTIVLVLRLVSSLAES